MNRPTLSLLVLVLAAVPAGAADPRLAVLPAGNAAETARWREMLEAWKSPSNRITVTTDREIDEELHPVDARCERGDHQLALRAREQLFERIDDFDL